MNTRNPSPGGGASDGNTPLDPDEAEGLIPDWIATRGDLDRAEHANVQAGHDWARAQSLRRDLLDVDFVRELHRRMFGDVWRWAGRWRTSEKNVGVAQHLIPTQLTHLFDDVRYWDEHGTWPLDERAARLHHRAVSIHPFANGNGRLTRELADLYLLKHGATPFAWAISLGGAARAPYIEALRAADGGDLVPLLRFVRMA